MPENGFVDGLLSRVLLDGPTENEIHHFLSAVANDDVEGMTAVLACGKSFEGTLFASPLHAAATHGAPRCVERLLPNETGVNLEDKDGYTPLHFAAMNGNREVIQALVQHRANPGALTRDYRAKLMEGGLKIDVPGGRNSLHIAAAEANFDAVSLLMNVDRQLMIARDSDGATAWDVVLLEGAMKGQSDVSYSRKQIAELLAPGRVVPPVCDLRAAAVAAQSRRRMRCDAAEAKLVAFSAGLPTERGYVSQDAELYELTVDTLANLLEPELLTAVQTLEPSARLAAFKELCSEIAPGVYTFRLFRSRAGHRSAHERLVAEVTALETWASSSRWELKRPNSMNRHGVVLEDVGLSSLVKALVNVVVSPLYDALWPHRADKCVLSDSHAFTVRYRVGEDSSLDPHVDSSEVTLNVCLGTDFSGGGVYFHALKDVEQTDPMTSPHLTQCERCLATHTHEIGTAVLHLGSHIHGAFQVEAGERTNLIVWSRGEPPALKI